MKQLRAIVAAFTFLTRVPSPAWVATDVSDLPRSVVWFPLVGLFVGASGALAFTLAQWVWPPILAIVISTLVTVWITGAFHEDALADSIDGFGGGWSREQVLAIMKDSRVGSYALVGVSLVIAAKIFALDAIFTNQRTRGTDVSPVRFVSGALVAAHVIARCSSVWLMAALPFVQGSASARPSAGGAFAGTTTLSHAVVATAIALPVVVLSVGMQSMHVVGAAILVSAIAGRYFHSRLGGITGDALGAANQGVELATYLALAARVHP